MGVPARYERNLGAFSEDELALVRKKSACVVGCGGLGGYAAAALARFGVGQLTLIDGDSFSVGNLNRQLFCTELSLGQNKAAVTAEALRDINSEVILTVRPVMLDEGNAAALLGGHDIVIDCLDSISARRLLADTCESLKIPLIHSAVSGLYGQAACIFPGDKLMDTLYPSDLEDGSYKSRGNPVFTPQLTAAVQTCEAVKLLAGREPALRHRVLYIDMLENDYEVVELPRDK